MVCCPELPAGPMLGPPYLAKLHLPVLGRLHRVAERRRGRVRGLERADAMPPRLPLASRPLRTSTVKLQLGRLFFSMAISSASTSANEGRGRGRGEEGEGDGGG